jgi:hypothetical protein
MADEKTSTKVISISGKVLAGKKATKTEVKTLAASV